MYNVPSTVVFILVYKISVSTRRYLQQFTLSQNKRVPDNTFQIYPPTTPTKSLKYTNYRMNPFRYTVAAIMSTYLYLYILNFSSEKSVIFKKNLAAPWRTCEKDNGNGRVLVINEKTNLYVAN